MNNLDKQYIALLQDILDNGVEKNDRTGTGTISVFGRQIRHKMSEGFPLLTTKKMPFKTITTELLWFLRGDTNIKYLVDNNCHIWDGDAYKKYWDAHPDAEKSFQYEGSTIETRRMTKDEFIDMIKTDDEFAKKWGDLGPIYGKQWRSWGGEIVNSLGEVFESEIKYDIENNRSPIGSSMRKYVIDEIKKYRPAIDQIANLINDLKTNPDSRRLMVNAWNVGEIDQMVLPPCHYGFQVYTRELSQEERYNWYIKTNNKNVSRSSNQFDMDDILNTNNIPKRAISLMWNQRSVDTFLGLPFNIASYGLLLEIIAKEVNMVPDELIGNLGDVHLYLNHIEQAKEQIGRELTLEERFKYWFDNNKPNRDVVDGFDELTIPEQTHFLDMRNIPTQSREPYPLPKLFIDQFDETNHYIGDMDDISEYNIEQFKLENYQSHPTIKAPLSN